MFLLKELKNFRELSHNILNFLSNRKIGIIYYFSINKLLENIFFENGKIKKFECIYRCI